MTRQTTAMMMVGPRSVSPWGDRIWRLALSAQLVEGNEPYWLVSVTQPANHEVKPDTVGIASPDTDNVVMSIVMLLAAHLGSGEVENFLVETHNLTLLENVREIAPFYDLSENTTRALVKELTSSVRLGFTLMEELSLVDAGLVGALRGLGFDVEVFAPLGASL